jgi:hypothetical protein
MSRRSIRDTLPEPARGGIGDIGLVDHERAAMLACSINLNLTVGHSHHPRNQRQCVGDGHGPQRQVLHLVGVEFLVCDDEVCSTEAAAACTSTLSSTTSALKVSSSRVFAPPVRSKGAALNS